MMGVWDRVLRGSAWAVLSLQLVVMAIGVWLLIIDRSPAPASDTLDPIGFYFVLLMFPLVGLLIVRRQPGNTVGWMLLGVGLVWSVGVAADSYARYGLVVSPGSLPGPAVAAAVNGAIWVPAIGLMGTFLILLYPDGHLPSRRWRPVAWLSGVTVVALTCTAYLTPGELELAPVPGLTNPLGWEAAQSILRVLGAVLLPLLPICIAACAGALVMRFRRSRGLERLQLQWLATGGAVVSLLYLMRIALRVSAPDERPPWLDVVDIVSFLSFALLPTAIGIAILRYRLYDIDVVINRALVYGSLTALLGAVYLGLVLLLQLLINPMARESDLAVAGSTLAVAGLFRPARARIQGIVDRRFYRRRYDAAKTLEHFGTRLRSELDLEALGSDLREVVHDTVQPAHVTLWLRARP